MSSVLKKFVFDQQHGRLTMMMFLELYLDLNIYIITKWWVSLLKICH